jgi:ribose transport system substrate-binding protein
MDGKHTHAAVIRRGSRAALVTFAAVVASATLAACGSSDSDSADAGAPATTTAAAGNGVAEAQKLVADGRKPATWKAPGPAVKDTASLKGKTFFYIANGIDLASIQAMIAGMKEASAALGMKLVVADGRGQPAEIAKQMSQAVGQKADIIATTSFPADSIRGALASAKEAGIPVLLGFAGDPGLPSAEEKALGVSGLMSFCYSCAGKMLADLAIADSNGKANAVIFDVPESPNTVKEREAAEAEFKRLCSDCKVTVKHAPLARWSTDLQSLTSSTLRSDPTITHVLPVWDAMQTFIKPAIDALGRQDKVKIISYNAELPAMKLLKAKDVVTAEVGSPLRWAGWALLDQAARLLTGMEPAADQNIPNRVFDAQNIDEVDLSKDDSHWYGVDNAAEYQRLWGIG